MQYDQISLRKVCKGNFLSKSSIIPSMVGKKQEDQKLIWAGVGVNFIPGDPCYREFVDFNKLLVERYSSTFIFDAVTNQPHINLYDIDVPCENLADIEVALQQVAQTTKPFIAQLDKVDCFDFGTIFVSCSQTEELSRLEKVIVEGITNSRNGCKTEYYWKPGRKYNQAQLENRTKYGNPFVLDTFLPHITVGFIKAGKQRLNDVVDEVGPKFSVKQFECNRLDLVIHDESGKLINQKRFKFGQGEGL